MDAAFQRATSALTAWTSHIANRAFPVPVNVQLLSISIWRDNKHGVKFLIKTQTREIFLSRLHVFTWHVQNTTEPSANNWKHSFFMQKHFPKMKPVLSAWTWSLHKPPPLLHLWVRITFDATLFVVVFWWQGFIAVKRHSYTLYAFFSWLHFANTNSRCLFFFFHDCFPLRLWSYFLLPMKSFLVSSWNDWFSHSGFAFTDFIPNVCGTLLWYFIRFSISALDDNGHSMWTWYMSLTSVTPCTNSSLKYLEFCSLLLSFKKTNKQTKINPACF